MFASLSSAITYSFTYSSCLTRWSTRWSPTHPHILVAQLDDLSPLYWDLIYISNIQRTQKYSAVMYILIHTFLWLSFSFERQAGPLLINWIESAIAAFFNFYIDRFLSTPTAFLPGVIQPVQRTLPTSLILDFLRDISLEKGSAAVVDLRLYYHNYRQLGESDALCRKSRPWPSSPSGKIHFAEIRNAIGHLRSF